MLVKRLQGQSSQARMLVLRASRAGLVGENACAEGFEGIGRVEKDEDYYHLNPYD